MITISNEEVFGKVVAGEMVNYEGINFRVERIDTHRIKQIRMTISQTNLENHLMPPR